MKKNFRFRMKTYIFPALLALIGYVISFWQLAEIFDYRIPLLIMLMITASRWESLARELKKEYLGSLEYLAEQIRKRRKKK